MSDDTEEVLVQDELSALKARADLLGLTYHPSIGLEKLRAKVLAAQQGEDEGQQTKEEPVAKPEGETEAQKRSRLKRQASELVRIRVTCMNPAKQEWEGEIFTVGNSLVGSFKKYVPFNADEGWHVPRIMYEQIKERQCQVFTTVTDSRGNKVRRGKLIREFAVELLAPLTKEELAEMARRQAMSKAID
jgi:hypothetical protein